MDLRAFFDSIDHDLMLKAVSKHTDLPWVLLYVKRRLEAPLQKEDGTLIARDRGTPQGSAISPLLANLFLHYAFDRWLAREFPAVAFERYADLFGNPNKSAYPDDGVIPKVGRKCLEDLESCLVGSG